MTGKCDTKAFPPIQRFNIRKSPYPSSEGEFVSGHFVDPEANTVLEKIRTDLKTNPMFDPTIRSFLRLGLMQDLIHHSLLLARIDRERLTLYRLSKWKSGEAVVPVNHLRLKDSSP